METKLFQVQLKICIGCSYSNRCQNGDVLSMASYPNYDPNKFVNGISYEDYQALQPKNKNDVLAANPQVNLATQGVFNLVQHLKW